MKQFIKDNGGLVAVIIVALAIGAAYLEWRISANLDSKLVAAGLVSPDKVQSIEDDLDDLETEHDSDIERVESKAERIAQILIED